MNWFNAIAVGFKEILANKFRSLLTMLGIILGVSSLVAMSALRAGTAGLLPPASPWAPRFPACLTSAGISGKG